MTVRDPTSMVADTIIPEELGQTLLVVTIANLYILIQIVFDYKLSHMTGEDRFGHLTELSGIALLLALAVFL
ncbi:hypothetical protein PG994_002367 [Apiospora phragmitis]|uniref:Uncharacterized protein n=1 Tax=Apiospora phragmitis TaxID=2905665 RepID=A0ABR1WW55_9PEZI